MLTSINRSGWLLLVLIILGLLYFGFSAAKNRMVANDFFQRYDVLTAVGDDTFALNAVAVNGKTIEKSDDGWTNVLPVPNSLEYILLTSSYSKGGDIPCGDKIIPKAVDNIGGENQWCIEHNDEERVSVASAQYYHYDVDEIVYETCLKEGYYEGVSGDRGFNGCAEVGLFLNDKQIAKTTEQRVPNPITGKLYLQDASSFNYHPSKKIGSQIIYSTIDGTYAYDTTSRVTKQLTNNEDVKLEDIFLTKEGKTISVVAQNNLYEHGFFGTVEYDGKVYPNVYSADYIDGNFYLLRLVEVKEKEGSSVGKVITYELLRNGKKIENIEIDGISPYGYSVDAIRQFPLCDTDTLVCVYEDGHYAYKNRTIVPEVFSYDFYVEEMVIDGEWRGDHIPNLIGRSKPIFEDGKLTQIVYTDNLGRGLYLADLSKKWTFKSLYANSGSVVNKLLGGHQNKLLNVVKK